MVVTIGISPAIAKRAGERYGGRAWAGGKLNEGATFYFARFCSIKCIWVDSGCKSPSLEFFLSPRLLNKLLRAVFRSNLFECHQTGVEIRIAQ